jgi:hypothetical protein
MRHYLNFFPAKYFGVYFPQDVAVAGSVYVIPLRSNAEANAVRRKTVLNRSSVAALVVEGAFFSTKDLSDVWTSVGVSRLAAPQNNVEKSSSVATTEVESTVNKVNTSLSF